MIPCVAYAVRSKRDERERAKAGGGAPASQLRRIRRRLHDDPDRELIGEHKEDGFSGSKRDRGPALAAAIQQAVAAADEHGSAELWAFISSRFARGSGRRDEARSLLELFVQMRRAGVTLRTVSDDEFITNEMLIGFASSQASKYAEDLSRSVVRGKEDQFERGEWLGGPVPEGFVLISERRGRDTLRTLIRDSTREQVIERMFALALERLAPATIARQLNSEGLRTAPRERKDGTVKPARPWTRRAVQNIITNATYAGAIMRHRGRPSQQINWNGNHRDAAYITQEQYELIQAAMAQRDRAKKGRPHSTAGRPSTRFALWKLATCGECGEPMFAQTSAYVRKDGTRRRTYVCQNYAASTGLCSSAPIDASAVDAMIVDKLDSLMFDFDAWFETVTLAERDERAAAEAELTVVLDGLTANDRRRRLVQRDYLKQLEAGKEAAAEVAAGALEGLQEERERLERAAANLREAIERAPDSAPVDAALDWWNDVRRQLRGRSDGRSMADVNAVLRDLFTVFRLTETWRGIVVEPVFTPPADLKREPWDEGATISESYDVPVGAAYPFVVGNVPNTHDIRLTKWNLVALTASQP